MCSTLPCLQLDYSTFTCVPFYLIYNWSIVHLHVFHFYLVYYRSMVNLHVFHFTLSTTGLWYIYMCSTLPYLQLEYTTFLCVQPMYPFYIFTFFVDRRFLLSQNPIQWVINNGTRSHIQLNVA